jgi:hypothetical protein
MNLLVLKLILTPLLIGVATLAARRWGQAVGGWVAGLPLTSGPVSLFLALEQGPQFAARAASATLLGLAGVCAFCLAYRWMLTVAAPWAAAAAGLVAYLLVALLLSFLSVGVAVATALVLVLLVLVMIAVGRPAAANTHTLSPWWDLPLRMTVATAMVLAITGAATLLGPRWTGLLSPFPVFACVMAMFAHHASGSAAAHRLLRGVIIGSFAFASFFLVVALCVEKVDIALAYSLAVVVALGVNGVSLLAFVRDRAAS